MNHFIVEPFLICFIRLVAWVKGTPINFGRADLDALANHCAKAPREKEAVINAVWRWIEDRHAAQCG